MAASSADTSRTRMTKRLPASAPRGNFLVWACDSSTSKPSPFTCASAAIRSPTTGRAAAEGTENHWDVTARRSFQPSVANVSGLAADGPSDLACDPLGVGIALANLDEHMCARTGGREAQVFFDDEVLGLNPQPTATERRPKGTRRRERTLDPFITHRGFARQSG
jgi:hypothetical protein